MNEEARPRMNLTPALIYAGLVLPLMFALTAYAWTRLPADVEIPVHWNMSGDPDRYSGKFEGLLLMPLIGLALSGLFVVLPYIEPRRLNFAGSRQAYIAIWIGTLTVLAAVHAVLVFTALGNPVNVNVIVPTLVGLFLMVIGNFLTKIRSNWFMGIRTPWTLSSERSWTKTHRLGAKLFIVMGLLLLLMPWLPDSPWVFAVTIGPIFAMTAFLVAYSYIVWRNDPDKQALGR